MVIISMPSRDGQFLSSVCSFGKVLGCVIVLAVIVMESHMHQRRTTASGQKKICSFRLANQKKEIYFIV